MALPLIGTTLSIITAQQNRFVGRLHSVNEDELSVTLEQGAF
jgi:hypothetical protein